LRTSKSFEALLAKKMPKRLRASGTWHPNGNPARPWEANPRLK
jgi:hypothetical protein